MLLDAALLGVVMEVAELHLAAAGDGALDGVDGVEHRFVLHLHAAFHVQALVKSLAWRLEPKDFTERVRRSALVLVRNLEDCTASAKSSSSPWEKVWSNRAYCTGEVRSFSID